MQVPFLDLRVTDPVLKAEMLEAIATVFDHGRILLGPEVDQFEEALAVFCGVKYAVGVGSGTDALILAAMALGIGEGDEVITTCLSFVGTANGIAMSGATPVFTDVRDDLGMDPEKIEALITPRTRAVLPVHFTGRMVDIHAIQAICDRHGLLLLEDAAQSIGAAYRGQRAGSFGAIGCLSINPMKVLNAMGEAGAVVTNDPQLRDRLVALRYNGLVNREVCCYRSFNGRLDTVQAAMLIPRLKRLDRWIARRRAIAETYQRRLSLVVQTPSHRVDYDDAYYTYTIQTDRRNGLQAWLAANGVETRIQHPLIIPQHPAYLEENLELYSAALSATNRVLCLPMHEKLSDNQVEAVCALVTQFFASG